MKPESKFARSERLPLVTFLKRSVFIATFLAVLGAAAGLAARFDPFSVTAQGVDLVRHTNNVGFQVMTGLTIASLGTAVCILVAGALIALTEGS